MSASMPSSEQARSLRKRSLLMPSSVGTRRRFYTCEMRTWPPPPGEARDRFRGIAQGYDTRPPYGGSTPISHSGLTFYLDRKDKLLLEQSCGLLRPAGGRIHRGQPDG